ncbi:FHA domain-containing protein [Granulicella mallensis]|nr:FHA domain-containing protein [Granulicella mallensis]
MNITQLLYFMSLAGSTAGLLAWAGQALLVSLLPVGTPAWLPVVFAAALLGGFIGGLTVAFDEKWAGNRVQARWVFSGAAIGFFGGAASGAVHLPLREALPGALPLATVLGWLVTGGVVGAGLGARWISVNRARLAHGMAGGICGGCIGGIAFALLSQWIPDAAQCLAFVLTGAGISFGIAFAPVLWRSAVLRFMNSGDVRAANKLGSKEWAVQDGDSYIVGSQSADLSKTSYGHEVDIYIPDASVAPRHARIFAKDGRFYITRHPDLMTESGLRRYLLRLQDRSVTTPRPLEDRSLIVVGRTTLMFVMKHKKSGQKV